MVRHLGPEAARNFDRRQREGFFENYLSGNAILDIGYRGGDPKNEPITETAIGIDLDYAGYDGRILPFPNASQDAVFASHVLEHIEDWAAALADWYRVLKIGGYMVIAVPHRDLYERKSAPPSRFNGDHKRFYTPASLLNEIEEALPVGGYRIRSLRDIDDDFDYTIPPDQHAAGCYEIELVVEKIPIPGYAAALRPPAAATEPVVPFAMLLGAGVSLKRRGQFAEAGAIERVLRSLPLPQFPLIRTDLEWMTKISDHYDLAREVRQFLEPMIARLPFDEGWYLSANPDVAAAVQIDPNLSAHAHFVQYGYFEGRAPMGVDLIEG
jgi:SAM-dependent methyltransferase